MFAAVQFSGLHGLGVAGEAHEAGALERAVLVGQTLEILHFAVLGEKLSDVVLGCVVG